MKSAALAFFYATRFQRIISMATQDTSNSDGAPQSTSPSPENAELQDSNRMMLVGTMALVIAMSANVVGAKYSRHALGKEIGRAWTNRVRNQGRNTRQQAAASASSSSSEEKHKKSAGFSFTTENEDEFTGYSGHRNYREAQESDSERKKAEDFGFDFTAQWEKARRQQEDFAKRAEEHARRDYQERESMRNAYREWSKRFGNARSEGYNWYWTGFESNSGFNRYGQQQQQHEDPYAILGVSSSASSSEIKDAYRKLARQYHPDSHSDPLQKSTNHAKFLKVQQAYESLKSNGARA